MSDKSISTLQNLVNANLNERIGKQIERESILIEQNAMTQISNNQTNQELNKTKKDAQFWLEAANIAKNKVKKLETEVEFYKNLLCKPMAEIANKNENFKETYKLQQELLADWMVSQKAFKELAIDFGIELGKTKEEVIKQGGANKAKVLNNKTKHSNNAEDSSIIEPHIEKLKSKL